MIVVQHTVPVEKKGGAKEGGRVVADQRGLRSGDREALGQQRHVEDGAVKDGKGDVVKGCRGAGGEGDDTAKRVVARSGGEQGSNGVGNDGGTAAEQNAAIKFGEYRRAAYGQGPRQGGADGLDLPAQKIRHQARNQYFVDAIARDFAGQPPQKGVSGGLRRSGLSITMHCRRRGAAPIRRGGPG